MKIDTGFLTVTKKFRKRFPIKRILMIGKDVTYHKIGKNSDAFYESFYATSLKEKFTSAANKSLRILSFFVQFDKWIVNKYISKQVNYA